MSHDPREADVDAPPGRDHAPAATGDLVDPAVRSPARALEPVDALAVELVRSALAENTWLAYESDWRIFRTWCEAHGLAPLPATAATVARFAAAQALATEDRPRGLAPSTIQRRLAAIRKVHLRERHLSPCDAEAVTDLVRGIRRRWGRPPAKKLPLLDEAIQALADTYDTERLVGLRDRALTLFGFASALRRSELVGLDVEHLEARPEGLRVTIVRSKTDQVADGQTIAVLRQVGSPWCPVDALEHWMHAAGIDRGPVFRRFYRGQRLSPHRLNGRTVADVVKRGANALELTAGDYSAHSFRRGWITQAIRNGEDLFKVADTSRHRDIRTLMAYRHDEELFANHAGAAMLREKTTPLDNP